MVERTFEKVRRPFLFLLHRNAFLQISGEKSQFLDEIGLSLSTNSIIDLSHRYDLAFNQTRSTSGGRSEILSVKIDRRKHFRIVLHRPLFSIRNLIRLLKILIPNPFSSEVIRRLELDLDRFSSESFLSPGCCIVNRPNLRRCVDDHQQHIDRKCHHRTEFRVISRLCLSICLCDASGKQSSFSEERFDGTISL